jgi:hypothetical protein
MRNALLVIALLLAASLGASAQTATVAQLTPAEAAQAKALHEAKLDLEKRQGEFDAAILDKYSSMHEAAQSTHPGRRIQLYAWTYGFEYSSDFKFIVSKSAPCYGSSCGATLPCGSWVTSTPAIVLDSVKPTNCISLNGGPMNCGSSSAPTSIGSTTPSTH